MFSKLNQYKIILASGSPRRQQFLKDLGLNFEVRLKEVNEIYPLELKGKEITDYLAALKADAFIAELQPNEILVTSDTIVWLNEKALGKPKDYQNAVEILTELSGNTHQVITSVALQSTKKKRIFHQITEVTFKKLTHQEIIYYIDNYKPFDKAGAYGIQEWIGLIGITQISGSYTNVVGLPTQDFFNELLCFIK